MSPQRGADAANISPYPFVVRQERQPDPSADPSDRGRNAKGRKTKAKPRAERTPRQEEEIRFNTGPRNLRVPPANRGGRRGFRMPGRGYADDHSGVPDYPPPSFQEAMTTPPLSVCSSTASLVPTTILPLAIPEDIPEHSEASVENPEASAENMAPLTEATESENIDNASDSDESLFIIEMNSVPVCSTDLPKGAALEERVRKDWRKRRGVEFPGRTSALETSHKENDNNDNKTATLGRIMTKLKLEIDPVPSPTQDHGRLSPISSPKRRFMSLSPLKTLFPPKSPVHHDRAMSAHPSPSPSPYAASRSTFFRSSSTLAAASFLGLPLLSSVSVTTSKSEPLSRKIFSNKGKERAKGIDSEHLDAWEVLSEDTYAGVDKNGDEHPRSLMSAVESLQGTSNLGGSSTRSQSFNFGAHTANTMQPKQPHIDSPEPILDEYSSQTPHIRAVASLRDWKGPSKVLLDRPITRRVPASLSTLSSTSITSSITSLLETPTTEMAPPLPGPPLTSVRIRATSPSPPPSLTLKHAHVAQPSPLRVDAIAKLNITTDKSAAAIALHQKALETPLPITPVHHTRFGGSLDTSPLRVPSPAQPVPDLLTDSISEPLTPQTAVPHLTISVQPPTILSASSLEPMTPTRHHYSGRPLPRPPPSASHRVGVVDSTYASNETPSHDAEKNDHSFNSCPEGLLIDLEDTTFDNFSVSGTSTPRSDECRFAPPPLLSTMSRTPSSVELLGDPSLSFDSIQAASTPLLPPSSGPSRTPQSAAFSDMTDLDLLVSRLTDGEQDGSDYDTLLLVQEVLGPANPTSPRAPPLDRVPTPKPSNFSDNMSLIGRIEIARRRKTAEGRIKLKITLLDVTVNGCGICLSQFRDGDMAALTSICQHSFHEKCLGRWLARAKTCPMCRVPLDTDIR